MDPVYFEPLENLAGMMCMGLMGGFLVALLIHQWNQFRLDWSRRHDWDEEGE